MFSLLFMLFFGPHRGADGAEGRQPRNVQGVRAGAPGGRKMVTVFHTSPGKNGDCSVDFSLILMSWGKIQ